MIADLPANLRCVLGIFCMIQPKKQLSQGYAFIDMENMPLVTPNAGFEVQ